MVKDSPILSSLFIVALVVFIFAAGHLFVLYTESSEIHPPYSSLRSDPLGTRAFYEGLEATASEAPHRNYQMLNRLPMGRDTTLFLLGASRSYDPKVLVDRVEQFAAEGGRVIIAFRAENTKPDPLEKPGKSDTPQKTEKPEEAKPAEADNPPSDGDTHSPDAQGTPQPQPPPNAPVSKKKEVKENGQKEDAEPSFAQEEMVLIDDLWGFQTTFMALPAKEGAQAKRYMTAPSNLPETLPWHSGLYFAQLSAPWEIVYAVDNRAVVIQRKWGNGTLILSSDSYLVSNEAMINDRYPVFLCWLAGSARRVLFDESHFGLVEQDTYLDLMQRYHLIGVLIALLCTVLVAGWWSASSLIPKRPALDEAEVTYIGGRDDVNALVNLLKRSIPPHEVAGACLSEWKRAFLGEGKGVAAFKEKQDRVQAILSRAAQPKRFMKGRHLDENTPNSPDAVYREICAVLGERLARPGRQTGKERP